jgi:hypothetical protein
LRSVVLVSLGVVLLFALSPVAAVHANILPGTSTLYVLTQGANGNQLTGYYAALSMNGVVMSSGYTPTNFTLIDGSNYALQVDGYGSCTFSHWAGSGSTADPTPITISADTTMTAVLNCGTAGPDPTTTAVSPGQTSVATGGQVSYSASVTDTAATPTSPTGTVAWSDGGVGGSFSSSTCTLTSSGGASASCQVTYTAPSAAGTVTITASYGGDTTHVASSGTASLTVTQAQSYTISKQSSGLIFQDSLNATMTQQQLSSQGTYAFDGSAASENAPYNYYEDSQGLHIGVKAPAPTVYAGYFAEKNFGTGTVFHAVMTAPTRTIPSDDYNVGIYVQTGSGDISYLYCGPDTSAAGTYWSVVEATSNNTNSATSYTTLYYNDASNQPLTGSCTIVTDGNNNLKVYIDDALVYSSTNAKLGYTEPLQMYLEVESSYMGAELYGSFSDFYVTTTTSMSVNNVPAGVSSVQLVNQSGTVIATATVTNGVATFDMGPYEYPVSANIVLKNASGGSVASGGPFNVYGGDVYTVS